MGVGRLLGSEILVSQQVVVVVDAAIVSNRCKAAANRVSPDMLHVSPKHNASSASHTHIRHPHRHRAPAAHSCARALLTSCMVAVCWQHSACYGCCYCCSCVCSHVSCAASAAAAGALLQHATAGAALVLCLFHSCFQGMLGWWVVVAGEEDKCRRHEWFGHMLAAADARTCSVRLLWQQRFRSRCNC